MTRRRARRAPSDALPRVGLALLAVATTMASGCFPTNNGPAPPQNQFYYPTGLVTSHTGAALYVVNSDFDLQYDAGTVIAIDLNALKAKVTQARDLGCVGAGLSPTDPASNVLYPGACSPIEIAPYIKSAVNVGAFASDMSLVERPTGVGTRLVIPVRGDPSLTWIDIDDERNGGSQAFTLSCDLDSDGRCGDSHRAGTDTGENTRGETMPPEPFAVGVSEDTSAMVTTHQTSGTTALFLNSWSANGVPDQTSACAGVTAGARSFLKPVELSFVLGGLPTAVTGIAPFPNPALNKFYFDNHIDYSFQPGFLVSYRSAAELDAIRYYDDCQAAPSRPYLVRPIASGIFANASGVDSRSIAMDASARKANEAACNTADAGQCAADLSSTIAASGTAQASPTDVYGTLPSCVKLESCLTSAAATETDVYVANRLPPSLLVAHTQASASRYGTSDAVIVGTTIPLSAGASRVQMAQIINQDGQLESRIFIVCFDSRLLYVFNPATGAVEATITTGRGPTALAFPPPPSATDIANDPHAAAPSTAPAPTQYYGYLANFTDSYLAALDLDMRHLATYLTPIANIGVPNPPRESK